MTFLALWVTACSSPPAAPVAASEARQTIVAAIARVAGVPVRIDAQGSQGGGEEIRLSGEVDITGGRGTWQQTTATAANVDVVADTTVSAGVVYARVYAANETPPGYTAVDDAALAGETLNGSFTVAGVFADSLDRIARMLTEVPFTATGLGNSERAGRSASGIRTDFASADVFRWLQSTGLEVVGDEPPTGGTITFEFWIAGDLLVGLVTHRDAFDDGELLHDVEFEVTYTPTDSVTVTIPS